MYWNCASCCWLRDETSESTHPVLAENMILRTEMIRIRKILSQWIPGREAHWRNKMTSVQRFIHIDCTVWQNVLGFLYVVAHKDQSAKSLINKCLNVCTYNELTCSVLRTVCMGLLIERRGTKVCESIWMHIRNCGRQKKIGTYPLVGDFPKWVSSHWQQESWTKGQLDFLSSVSVS